jgi:hypothetical protein
MVQRLGPQLRRPGAKASLFWAAGVAGPEGPAPPTKVGGSHNYIGSFCTYVEGSHNYIVARESKTVGGSHTYIVARQAISEDAGA